MTVDKQLLIDKLKATGTHLCISAVLAVFCYIMINQIWYQTPLVEATDVWSIFIMMLVVDLILGPLLTFVVFKKGKKTLKFDLLVIGCIQISALGYGLYTMYEGRPIFYTFVADRFELIRANDFIEDDKVELAIPKFSPQYAYVNIKPKTADEQFDMAMLEISGDISPAQQPKYYDTFDQAIPFIVQKSLPLTDLDKFNKADTVQKVLKGYPQADSYLPLKASVVDMTVLINKKDGGKVVDVVDLRPWKK